MVDRYLVKLPILTVGQQQSRVTDTVPLTALLIQTAMSQSLMRTSKPRKKADIVIAEVGAWSNPISIDDTEREAALEKCRIQLALADRIGANCCVNISGSRGPKWDGPHPDNLTDDTFDLIVESVRLIIDDVKPTRTFYALETMPWAYPEGPDSYLGLLKAIDREARVLSILIR